MNTVFLKTRELADAIIRSEEYNNMKKCEEIALNNEAAAAAIAEYIGKRNEIGQLMENGSSASARLKTLSKELQEVQDKMSLIPEIVDWTNSREDFSNLMDQVNTVLRFIISGETGENADKPSSCSINCSNCGGCSKFS